MVPNTYKENPGLASWVWQQRQVCVPHELRVVYVVWFFAFVNVLMTRLLDLDRIERVVGKDRFHL